MNAKIFTDIKSVFFDNLTIKQTIFKNTFWLTIGLGLNRLLKLILFIYAARILGATEYGKFAFALAFISLFGVFQDLGISTIIIREFSREEEKDKEREKEIHSLISLEFLLSFGTFILILFSSFFITVEPDIRRIILILALFASFNSMVGFFYSLFQARQRMEYQTWAETFQTILVAGLGIFVLLKIPSAENLSYVHLFSVLAGLFFILIFFHSKIFPLKISWEKSVWRKFLMMSWPLALTNLFDSLYSNIDSVMLGYWGMIAETGWYNAASRVTWTIFLLASLVSVSIYPVLSKAFKETKEKFQEVWNYQMELIITAAFPLMVGGIVLAPRIINFIYGTGFTSSILAFQILIITVGILLIYNCFYHALLISNQQKKLFWIIFSGATINIILNLILIPKYSLYGAAIATVISYLLILYLLFRSTLKFTSIRVPYLRFLIVFIGVFLSGAIMLFVISRPQIYYLHVLLSILIGIGTYLICLSIYRKLTNQLYYQKIINL